MQRFSNLQGAPAAAHSCEMLSSRASLSCAALVARPRQQRRSRAQACPAQNASQDPLLLRVARGEGELPSQRPSITHAVAFRVLLEIFVDMQILSSPRASRGRASACVAHAPSGSLHEGVQSVRFLAPLPQHLADMVTLRLPSCARTAERGAPLPQVLGQVSVPYALGDPGDRHRALDAGSSLSTVCQSASRERNLPNLQTPALSHAEPLSPRSRGESSSPTASSCSATSSPPSPPWGAASPARAPAPLPPASPTPLTPPACLRRPTPQHRVRRRQGRWPGHPEPDPHHGRRQGAQGPRRASSCVCSSHHPHPPLAPPPPAAAAPAPALPYSPLVSPLTASRPRPSPNPLQDPSKSLPFVSEILKALRKEVDGQSTLLGFIGACCGRTAPPPAAHAPAARTGQPPELPLPPAASQSPAGTPWTLAAYAIEGSSNKYCMRSKKMMQHNPEVLHAFLAHLADSLATYVCFQIESGAQARAAPPPLLAPPSLACRRISPAVSCPPPHRQLRASGALLTPSLSRSFPRQSGRWCSCSTRGRTTSRRSSSPSSRCPTPSA